MFAVLCAVFASLPSCKAKSPEPFAVAPARGKMVVALANIQNVRIELPDQSYQDFGRDLQARLTTHLTNSNRYIVADSQDDERQSRKLRARSLSDDEDEYYWNGTLTPAATVRIRVEELSFTSGNRGNRMFYGFSRNFRTPYNSGSLVGKNEYPLRTVKFEPTWFDRTFDRKGGENTGSQAGLDLGEGFELNVLFAYFRVKQAQYFTSVGLDVEIDAPLAGKKDRRVIDVVGKGYFYDVVGGYLQYSGGIRVARSDAMDQALKYSLQGSLDAIERGLTDLPLVARIDGIIEGSPNTLLLGTGFDSSVAKGTVYESVENPSLQIIVEKSQYSGAVARIHKGDPSIIRVGMLFREFRAALGVKFGINALGKSRAGEISASESIELPLRNIPKKSLGEWVDEISKWEAIGKSIVGTATLIYRAWRYRRYDQPYRDSSGTAHSELEESEEEDAQFEARSSGEFQHAGHERWSEKARDEKWASQVGLSYSSQMRDQGTRAPVVAIIDTGVDYNHDIIHSRIWLEPKSGERGWDFVSNDDRAYDDSYHGTQVASAVLAVAPYARLMPLKVFNPFGITSSASLFAAFRYAVDHGAQIIVCGWGTRLHSDALEKSVAYARSRNVLVVAAAGDRGENLRNDPAYPGNFAKSFDNVLTVMAVDLEDQPVSVRGKSSNFGGEIVGMAAPGLDLKVAEPRNRLGRETGTGIAAGLAAGAIAKNLASRDGLVYQGTPAQWILRLQDQADQVPDLIGHVRQGYRLRIE